jgi:hypothetical protein
MSTERGTLHTIARHLVLALAPLKEAVSDRAHFRSFLFRLGWEAESLPPEYTALAAKVDAATSALEGLGDDPSSDEILGVLGKVSALYTAIKAITTAPEGIDAGEFLEELARNLFDLLMADYMAEAFPDVRAAFLAIGLLVEKEIEETESRPGGLITRFQWEEIPNLLLDPGSIPMRLYGWGTNDFAFDRLTGHLLELFVARHWPASIGRVDQPLSEGFKDLPGDRSTFIEWGLKIPVLLDSVGGQQVEVGLALLELPAQSGKPPGLILRPLIPSAIGTALQLTGELKLELRAGSDVASTFGVLLRPDDISVRYPFEPGASLPAAGFAATLRYAPANPALLLGAQGKTRLEAQGLATSLIVETLDGQPELRLEAAPEGLKLVLAADDLDGFLSELMGGGDRTVPIALGLRLSNRTGLGFIGGTGLEIAVHPNLALGPIRVDRLDLGIRSTARSGEAANLTTEIGLAVGGDLGPLAFSVDGIGLKAEVVFSDGNAGPLNVEFGFTPPKGAGLVVSSSLVTGGGFLRFDPAKGEYSGNLQLEVAETIAVKAVGLLTTRMPDGSRGFSLIVILSAEGFAPIQLGLGFTLTGIGGLLGINRTAMVDVLRNGLKNGVLGSILFPADPIRNAPQIVSDLRSVFPPVRGRHVFGPVAKIAWGTPTILTLELALILELPAPVRLIILGRLKAILPDERAALVQVRMDAVGVIDFNQGEVSLDATLYDSRVLDFALTGDMALRASWGAQPTFVLAIGGFNPRFKAPAGFPALKRLALNLSTGNSLRLQCQAYFALTSNTAQFGARVDLHAEGGGFTVDGYLGLDALFQFTPFSFVVDIGVGVALRYHGRLLMGIFLDGTLAGPTPWHVKGKASFKILFFKVSISVDRRIGRDAPAPLPEAVDVLGLLVAAVRDARNWSGELPRGEHPLVTFREQTDTATLRVHPLAQLTVRQRVVPLNTTIEMFGNAPVAGANQFTLAPRRADAGDGPLPLGSSFTRDSFAMAQFQRLTDDEKLSRPSFELRDAGVRFGTDEVAYHHDPRVDSDVEYETQMYVPGQQDPPEPASGPRYVMPASVLDAVIATGAAGQAPIRRTGNARYRAGDAILN